VISVGGEPLGTCGQACPSTPSSTKHGSAAVWKGTGLQLLLHQGAMCPGEVLPSLHCSVRFWTFDKGQPMPSVQPSAKPRGMLQSVPLGLREGAELPEVVKRDMRGRVTCSPAWPHARALAVSFPWTFSIKPCLGCDGYSGCFCHHNPFHL
jgi:hypothetical protein